MDERYASLARTLGGCPENIVGGRFQRGEHPHHRHPARLRGRPVQPRDGPKVQGAPLEKLLPGGRERPPARWTARLAEQIATHQYRTLLGRSPTPEELAEARDAGTAVRRHPLHAPRSSPGPLCFALLSSAERLFY